jgi:hypothetical protein
MVSLARGAASPLKMRIFAQRRADQLTIKTNIAEKLLQQLRTIEAATLSQKT